jgi:DNA-binding XRE family transcriptional regulator
VGFAVLYATLQAVERDRQRPAVAIDAGRVHHDLLMGWRDLPKDTRTPHLATTINNRIELLAPGRSAQLTLDLDPESGTMGEALIRALRDTRGWKGLRHWAALQKLLSVDGGRAGWVRWTLDGHLSALGTRVKNRTKATLRADIARQVEAFTRLELAAYAADGTLRERRPLLLVGAKYDRLHGSEWKLDGMQLTINPLLYSGVREAGGRLGRNWHPAPVELASVDDKHHPYTLALGLILPIRWRLALEEGKDHITLKGHNALALAGVPYRARKPGVAWKALERDLTELHRIGGLGRWAWDAADTPHTLEGRLHLWPAPWMLDRTFHDVKPIERQLGPAVLTGAELKTWRKRRGLTQGKAAETLHVNPRTIMRAEKHPAEPLSTALTAKLRAAGA